MRKIDEQTMTAVKHIRNFKNKNTEVRVTSADGCYIVSVFLHRNRIFTGVRKDGVWKDMQFSYCGWATNVTSARLNACLQATDDRWKCYVKNGEGVFEKFAGDPRKEYESLRLR